MPQVAGHAGNAGPAALLGFVDHAGIGLLAAFVDDLGDLRDFAAEGAFQSGADAADEAERIDAVADHQFAGGEALEVQAIDFIAGEPGHDWHGESLLGRGR